MEVNVSQNFHTSEVAGTPIVDQEDTAPQPLNSDSQLESLNPPSGQDESSCFEIVWNAITSFFSSIANYISYWFGGFSKKPEDQIEDSGLEMKDVVTPFKPMSRDSYTIPPEIKNKPLPTPKKKAE